MRIKKKNFIVSDVEPRFILRLHFWNSKNTLVRGTFTGTSGTRMERIRVTTILSLWWSLEESPSRNDGRETRCFRDESSHTLHMSKKYFVVPYKRNFVKETRILTSEQTSRRRPYPVFGSLDLDVIWCFLFLQSLRLFFSTHYGRYVVLVTFLVRSKWSQ